MNISPTAKTTALTVMTFLPLEVPALDEGCCLLESSALEKLRKQPGDVVVIHYVSGPHQAYDSIASDTDSREERSGWFTSFSELLGPGLYTTKTPISINKDYLPRFASRFYLFNDEQLTELLATPKNLMAI